MVLFLYGADAYRSRARVRELIARYGQIAKSGTQFQSFEGSFDIAKLQIALHSVSMFSEKRFFLLTDVLNTTGLAEFFTTHSQRLASSDIVCVVRETGSVKKTNAVVKIIAKNATRTQEYALLRGADLSLYVQRLAFAMGITLSSSLIACLLASGSDLWRIEQEIKKLVAFSAPLKKAPEKAKALLVESKEAEIFAMLRALLAKNTPETLARMRRHEQQGDAPLYVLSMMVYQIRNLLIVKDLQERQTPYLELATKTKLRPFMVTQLQQAAPRFSFAKLAELYITLIALDKKMKSGQQDGFAPLERFVILAVC